MGISDSFKSIYILDQVSLPESIGLILFWKIVWFFKFNRTKIKYIFLFYWVRGIW